MLRLNQLFLAWHGQSPVYRFSGIYGGRSLSFERESQANKKASAFASPLSGAVSEPFLARKQKQRHPDAIDSVFPRNLVPSVFSEFQESRYTWRVNSHLPIERRSAVTLQPKGALFHARWGRGFVGSDARAQLLLHPNRRAAHHPLESGIVSSISTKQVEERWSVELNLRRVGPHRRPQGQ